MAPASACSQGNVLPYINGPTQQCCFEPSLDSPPSSTGRVRTLRVHVEALFGYHVGLCIATDGIVWVSSGHRTDMPASAHSQLSSSARRSYRLAFKELLKRTRMPTLKRTVLSSLADKAPKCFQP